MAVAARVIEGQTARVLFQLTEDGSPFDGTGFTVSAMFITGADGVAVTTTAKFGWDTQATAIVYFDPGATDFDDAKQPYRLRVKLTDGGGKIRFYPDGASAEIMVRPVVD